MIDTPLARQTHAVLAEMAQHLTPNDRARLRTMPLTDPPLLYWMLLASVPPTQAENPATEAVWRVVLPALGRVYPARRGVGRVLFETELSEMRMERLLTATGQALVASLTETVRWLIAHEVERVAIEELATLGLADALGDRETLEQARKRIALDFAHAAHAAKLSTRR
jgi:hypothetical protein